MKKKNKEKSFSKDNLVSLVGVLSIIVASLVSQIPQNIKVIGVIDGDTVVLEGKETIRLRYVDAPEKGMCGYEESVNALKNLALGKNVRVEKVIPDQYGRGMALIYENDILINKELIATGWVRYHSDNSQEKNEIKSISENAKNNKLGIYSKCIFKENIINPKCNIKGNIDKNKYKDNKKYYYPGCAQYEFTIVEKDQGEDFFCSTKEAESAGFLKAETCK